MAFIKQRRPNFNQEEIRALILGVEKRNGIIDTRIGAHITSRMKRDAWEEITDEVNSVSTLHDPRTVEEVQRRYRDYKHRNRKKGARYQPYIAPYEGNDSGGDISNSAQLLNQLGCEELSDSSTPGDVKPVLHVINIQSNSDNPLPSLSGSIRPSPSPVRTSPEQENIPQGQNSPPMMEWMVTLQERLIIAVEQLVEDFCEQASKASMDRQRIATALEGILSHLENKKKSGAASSKS